LIHDKNILVIQTELVLKDYR